MIPSPPEIVLVTPVWNDATRLSAYGPDLAAALATSGLPLHWVVADDGSAPAEIPRLERLIHGWQTTFPTISLHAAATHHGKGAVIRDAWNRHPQARWLAFVDADGSVSATEMIRLLRSAIARGRPVIGVRRRTDTTTVRESTWRGLVHLAYLQLAQLLLGIESSDIQCGAKVIDGPTYRNLAPDLRENGLAFDSELLAHLAATGIPWDEIPLNWEQRDGGNVTVRHDALHMATALWRIRKRLDEDT